MANGEARERKRHEYLLRLEQEAAAEQSSPESSPVHADEDEVRAARVEFEIQQAIRNGEFDNLPEEASPSPASTIRMTPTGGSSG